MKNKSKKQQEELFQSHIESEKISASRTMCLLGALLYMVFAVADIYSLSVTLTEVLIVRGVVIVLFFSAVALSYSPYLKIFVKHYDLILSVLYLIGAAGIQAMIFLAMPEDHASNVYFVGLLLIIMTIFAWSYFKFRTSLIVTALIISSYSFIEIHNGMSTAALSVNIVFLLSGAIIAYISQLIRDRYIRENFILQQSLQEKVQEKTKEAEIHEHLANHDQLTGLANSRNAKNALEKNLKLAKASGKSMVIMYLDLNGFKQVNDIYGHRAGDEVLRIVGKRLKACVRTNDCLARLGGDEFGIGLIVDKNELGIAQDIREKIEDAIAQPIGFEGNILQISTSIGMAVYPASGNQVSVLIEIADKRMYQAKQKMKNKISGDEEIEFSSYKKTKPVVIFPG